MARLPIGTSLSFFPFPNTLQILLSKEISEVFNWHNSESLKPEEYNSSAIALSLKSPQVVGWKSNSLLTISVSIAFGSKEFSFGALIPDVGLFKTRLSLFKNL